MIENISESIQEPYTVPELKEQIIHELDEEASLLSHYITVSRQWAESYAALVFPVQSFRLTVDCFTPEIELEKSPLISVVSVKYDDRNGVEQTLPSGQYVVRHRDDGNYLVPPYGECWPTTELGYDKVRIEYQAGYQTVPAVAVQAMMLIAGDLYNNREDSVLGSFSFEQVPLSARRLLDTVRLPKL